MIQTTEPVFILPKSELDALLLAAATAGAEAVLRRLGNAPAVIANDLWTAAQCAIYLGISAHTWAYQWAHRPGAPKARVMGDGPKAKRRWLCAEVMDWAERQAA